MKFDPAVGAKPERTRPAVPEPRLGYIRPKEAESRAASAILGSVTAKEALLAIVSGWSEAEASLWLRAIEPRQARRSQNPFLSAVELQALPKYERSAAIRAQLALLTPEELEEDLSEWEDWESGTGSDARLIDG